MDGIWLFRVWGNSLYPLFVEAETVVSRGIRIFLVIAAAAVSVVSIPFVVILAGGSQGVAWSLAGIVAAVVGALVSFLFATAAYYESSRERTMRKVLESLNKLPSGTAVTDPGSEHVLIVTEGPAEASLLQELSALEREAQRLFDEGHSTSVIRLRSRLRESGVWSDKDVYDFDIALVTRNKIAHGDQEELSKASVIKAVETMRRLRGKVHASQLQEGG